MNQIHTHLLQESLSQQSQSYIFATLSGAHLYGFPSPDSDYDIRGVHVLEPRDVLGLTEGPETIETMFTRENVELDLVSHDAKKFFNLLLKRNGYALEQVLSPHIVLTCDEHGELSDIAKRCVTKGHAYHYLGFAATTWKQFNKEPIPRIKPLLYTFRVLLTGIHLMKTGQLEANLLTLNEIYQLPYINSLVQQKINGAEQSAAPLSDLDLYSSEYHRLVDELKAAQDQSSLPDEVKLLPELHDLLIRVRLDGLHGHHFI